MAVNGAKPSSNSGIAWALGLFLLICAAYLFASYSPGGRYWAFDIFAYINNTISYGLLIATVIGGLVAILFCNRPGSDTVDENNRADKSVLVIVLVSAVIVSGFYLLRARVFFFGDGYMLLRLLATGNPLIEKLRQLAESMIHLWLYKWIGGTTEADAVVTYQVISITAGFVYLMAVIWLVRKLFTNGTDRLLFFLGICSGGWMLLYFGYVENYSVFVLMVMIYSLVGTLPTKRRLTSWLIVILQLLLVSTHIFGVTLIPATIYLLLHKTAPIRRLGRLSRSLKLGISLILLATAFSGFVFALSSDLFFKVSLVPLFEYALVPEGYTLFSKNHLLDFVNLLFLLLPGFLVLLVGLGWSRIRDKLKEPVYRWLGLAALGSLGAAFIFDPKLGMPRDWDLFSFSGVPLAVFLYYGLLDKSDRSRRTRLAVLLSVVLGFSALTARAIWISTPEVGIAHFRDYLYLDKVKNRNGWLILVNYYKNLGDSVMAEKTRTEWKSNFPEEELMVQANDLYFNQRNFRAADSVVDLILRINPALPDAYGFKGYIYLDRGKFDSALVMLRFADALSPNRPNVLNNMALAYSSLGRFDRAESVLLKAAHLDSAGFAAQYNLAAFYRSRGEMAKYMEYLIGAAAHPDSNPAIIKELVVAYLQQSNARMARKVYCSRDDVRNDTTFISALRKQIPTIDSVLICR